VIGLSGSDLYVVEVLDPISRGDHLYVVEVLERLRVPQKSRTCPYCGGEAVFLTTLARHYCFDCKRYI